MSVFSRDVHAVCLWDDKGPAKIHQALKEDILDFIKQAQAVSVQLERVQMLFLTMLSSCVTGFFLWFLCINSGSLMWHIRLHETENWNCYGSSPPNTFTCEGVKGLESA